MIFKIVLFGFFFYCRIENEKYIDINDTDYDTRSALHLAACGGHYKAVAFLLNNDAGYLERKDW